MIRGITRWWFAPVPAQRLAALRIVVGLFAVGYLGARLPHLFALAHFDRAQFQPIGVVSVLDRPLLPIVVQMLTLATFACSIAFVLGYRRAVLGPLFALLLLWTLTYRNSWGMVFHTENLLVLHVVVLALSDSEHAWSLDARRRGVSPPEHGRYGWPLKLMCAVVVCAYLIAGVAKLKFAGMAWVWGDDLRNYIATDNLRKLLLDDFRSPIAPALLHYTWLFRGLALGTLLVELGAPLALLGRRAGLVWVGLIVGFHWGVFALMMIGFPYQMSMVGFACFFRAEHVVSRVLQRWRRRGASVIEV